MKDPQVVVVVDPNQSYNEQMMNYHLNKIGWDVYVGKILIIGGLILAAIVAVVIAVLVWGSGLTDPNSKNSLKLDAHNAHVELDHALAVANGGPGIDVQNAMQNAQSAVAQHSRWEQNAVDAYNKAKFKEDSQRAEAVAKAQAKANEADAKLVQ